MEKPALRTAMSFLLGGWLIGTILVGFVAAENFWLIDRLLLTSLHPTFHEDVGMLPAGEARAMLRYLASEQNRFFFVWWGWAEAVLGIVLLLMAARSSSGRLLLGFALMLALVAVSQLYLTPRIVEVGRSLDFVPREPPPPNLRSFSLLHAVYSAIDLIKLAIGGWMTWLLLKQSKTTTKAASPQEHS
ncbi:MAG: hypothetical protein HYX73_06875 [Acidobacteria bacterium]|nr:hypothetical protein [Acidobacteriota bacterium]